MTSESTTQSYRPRTHWCQPTGAHSEDNSARTRHAIAGPPRQDVELVILARMWYNESFEGASPPSKRGQLSVDTSVWGESAWLVLTGPMR